MANEMKIRRIHFEDEMGFALIIAVIMMMVFIVAAGLVVSLVSTDSELSFHQSNSAGGNSIARAGIERALKQFKGGTACGSLSYTNTIGSGSYTTTATRYNPSSTTLSAGIGTSDATIPVVSTTGYSSHGRITIQSESIDYTGTTATSYTGAKRGTNGTTAASHSSGASVAQDYCLIRSTGIITSSLGNAQRVVETGLNGTWPSSPPVNSVQTGTVSVPGNGGTNTITVAAAQGFQPITDMTKAFLIVQTSSTSVRPSSSTVRGRIASTSTLEFVRVDNSSSPVDPALTVRWYVVSYASGIKVQRGFLSFTTAGSPSTMDVPITAVASLNRAFVIFSSTPHTSDALYGTDDPATAELTALNNLRIGQGGSAGGAGPHSYYWQVVEFLNAADIDVQAGALNSCAAGPADNTNWTVALGTPVDPSKTFVLVGHQECNFNDDRNVGRSLLRAQLYNFDGVTTTPCIAQPTCNRILIDRAVGTVGASTMHINRITWQAITLKEGSRVQGGRESFGSSTTLFAAIAAGDTIIPVNSTAGYGSAGRVRIDAEDIDYTGTSTFAGCTGFITSPFCLTGATRGAGVPPTIPAIHANGASVGNSRKVVTLGIPVGSLSNSAAFSSVQSDGGGSMGSSIYCSYLNAAPCGADLSNTDHMGVGLFRLSLTATNKLTIERDYHTHAGYNTSADVGWFVVEFGASGGGGGGGGSSNIIDSREVYN